MLVLVTGSHLWGIQPRQSLNVICKISNFHCRQLEAICFLWDDSTSFFSCFFPSVLFQVFSIFILLGTFLTITFQFQKGHLFQLSVMVRLMIFSLSPIETVRPEIEITYWKIYVPKTKDSPLKIGLSLKETRGGPGSWPRERSKKSPTTS